jgi:hypothetical protein
VSGGGNRSEGSARHLCLGGGRVELTSTSSVEDLYNFCDICKTLCVDVSTLTQLIRIVACKLERRIPAQCTPPVVQQNGKCELPLLDLIAHHVVDLVLDSLED